MRPPALDAWVDGRVAAYTRAMRQARLVSYLAARGGVRVPGQPGRPRAHLDRRDAGGARVGAVGAAEHLGHAGHRGRPSRLKVVISLRDHLLQLADATRVAPGEQPLSPTQRFKLLLRDPRFAVFAGGTYAGQRIPFSLVPLGALQGNTLGIPVFAATDCAERIWSVNAAVSGSSPLVRGPDRSFSRVDLLQSNTFFSQRCDASAEPFQLASVRRRATSSAIPSSASRGPRPAARARRIPPCPSRCSKTRELACRRTST